jgi:NADPH-ferrihemoprotein reductase
MQLSQLPVLLLVCVLKPSRISVLGPAWLSSLQVLHLELDISSSGMQYAPGDSIGVLPQNEPALVAALLERLGLEGDAVFAVAPAGEGAAAAANGGSAHDSSREHLLPHLGAPCSVRAALSRGVDLTGPPRKSLLRLLAEHCGEATERRRLLHLCSRDGREEYAAEMLAGRPSLLHLLRQFPSCRPPLDALLDALPPLAARMYSLSCSPLECPGKVGNFLLPALACPALLVAAFCHGHSCWVSGAE